MIIRLIDKIYVRTLAGELVVVVEANSLFGQNALLSWVPFRMTDCMGELRKLSNATAWRWSLVKLDTTLNEERIQKFKKILVYKIPSLKDHGLIKNYFYSISSLSPTRTR